jgi:hypothetical protein
MYKKGLFLEKGASKRADALKILNEKCLVALSINVTSEHTENAPKGPYVH